jgi:Zn-dependent membrane protease YugP
MSMFLPLILMLGTFALSLWAAFKVKSAYRRWLHVPASSGMTGAEAAQRILAAAGIRDVEIVGVDGELVDHYDPMLKRLVLSRENYLGTSVAALSVAAHECGHALQHQQKYAPLEARMAAVGATNFASQIVMWLPIIGMATGILATYTGVLIMAIGWGIIMLFNLITLPVEFDASRRAKAILTRTGMVLEGREAQGVNQVLNAAALTYVAAFLTSLVYFLWYLLPLLTGRR